MVLAVRYADTAVCPVNVNKAFTSDTLERFP